MKLKILTRISLAILGTAFFAVAATSCNDDDNNVVHYYLDMATVEAPDETGPFFIVQEPFSLLGDNNETLYPAYIDYYLGGYRTEDQQRVLIEYILLSDEKNGYDHYIRLTGFRNVLTKDMAVAVDGTAADSPLLSTDPVKISSAWYANGYVNIIFIYKGTAGEIHYINLVKDTKSGAPANPEAGVLTLTLAHDADGDTETYFYKGIASFEIPAESMTGVNTIKIKFNNFGTETVNTITLSDSAPSGKLDEINSSDIK